MTTSLKQVDIVIGKSCERSMIITNQDITDNRYTKAREKGKIIRPQEKEQRGVMNKEESQPPPSK